MNNKPRTSNANGRLWGTRAQDWASLQEPVHSPLYEAAFEAVELQNGQTYLDVGCGAGGAIALAAARGAKASGLDAAVELLEIASSRTPPAVLRRGDLEDLPFDDDSFDVVTGFNSFQYAGNPVNALAEARRVARPGANLIIATWGEPEGMDAAELVGAIKPLLPPPPPGAPGPFALSEENALRDFAGKAGLHTDRIFDVDCPFDYPDVETGVRANCSAGVAVKAIEAAGQDAVEAAYRAVLESFVQDDGSVRVMARFRCLVAGL